MTRTAQSFGSSSAPVQRCPGRCALDRSQLAVIVNVRAPLSVQIGKYYAERRRITFHNFIKVGFAPDKATLTREEFEQFKEQVDRQTRPEVQAYALTWAAPYRIVERRPGDIAQCYADPSLARETLGWQAQLGIEAMCADTWRWQRWAAKNITS